MTWDGKERRKMFSEDHDLLIKIDTKLDRALGDLNTLDGRVKTLEQGYWKVVGGVACIVVIGNAAVKWLFK